MAPANGLLPPTRWTMVIAAGKPVDPESCQALKTLCEGYWYPVYSSFAAKATTPDSAGDLTQGFFTALLGGTLFERAKVAERGHHVHVESTAVALREIRDVAKATRQHKRLAS